MIPDDAVILNNGDRTIYLMDLESYIRDEISLGNFKESQKDYITQCPYCRDAYLLNKEYIESYSKYKLYTLKDFSIGHCFRCDSIFINRTENINTEIDYPDFSDKIDEFSLVKLDDPIWKLNTFYKFEEFDELGYDYLINKRHKFFDKLTKILNIRFSNHNPVIPFYFHNEFIYYQTKMAFGNSRIPYFDPPISRKPAYIIEHGNNKKFVISEGTFDGIADLILYPDRTPFCLLGSSITDYQLWMLRSYTPEDILVYLDSTELSKKVAQRISKVITYADISIRYSKGIDPEEYLKYLISTNKITYGNLNKSDK